MEGMPRDEKGGARKEMGRKKEETRRGKGNVLSQIFLQLGQGR